MAAAKSKKAIKPKAPAARREQPAPPIATPASTAAPIVSEKDIDTQALEKHTQRSTPAHEASTIDNTPQSPKRSGADLPSPTTKHNLSQPAEQPPVSVVIDFAHTAIEPSPRTAADDTSNAEDTTQASRGTADGPSAGSQPISGSYISRRITQHVE